MDIKTEEKFSNDVVITELHEISIEQKIVGKCKWQKGFVGVGGREFASLRRKTEINEFLFKFQKVAININKLWN